MKEKINNKEIERIAKMVKKAYGDVMLTPEEWRFKEKARKRTFRRIMFKMGLSTFIVYIILSIFDFSKKTVSTIGAKVFTVKGVLSVISAISISGALYLGLTSKTVPEKPVVDPVVIETIEKEVPVIQNGQVKEPVQKTVIPKAKLGIRQFITNSNDITTAEKISSDILDSVRSVKGKHFVRLLKPGERDVPYILSGYIDIHDDNTIRVNIRIFNSKTSKIILFDSRTFSNRDNLSEKCTSITIDLIRKLK